MSENCVEKMSCSIGEYEFSPGAPPWSSDRGDLRAAEGWIFLHQELASAFKRLAQDLQSINSKGKKYAEAYEYCRRKTPDGTVNTVAEASHCQEALRSLMELCAGAASEAETLSKFISDEVIPPVSAAMRRGADDSGNGENCKPATSVTGANVAPTSNDIQKASKRLQLAEEELSVG